MPAAMPNPHDALTDPDVQLMLRAQRGDRAAFAELVGAYHPLLVRKLTYVLRHAVDAEDVAQEVLVRAYVARGGYRPSGRFSAWLFRIAHNTACNFRRDRARRREVFQIMSYLPADRSCGTSSRPRAGTSCDGEDPHRAEAIALLQEALMRLNARQREALMMQHLDGKSCAEIASVLAIGPGAVRSLLARARYNLRRVVTSLKRRGEVAR